MQKIVKDSDLDTKKDPFLIFHGKSNAKILSNSLMDISDLYFQELGFRFYHKTTGEDLLIYFHDIKDFEVIMTPRHEPLKEIEFIESRVGPLDHDFFIKRNQIIGTIIELYKKK